MSSHPIARPSDSALRAALLVVMTHSQPPPLVPHPPTKKIAWRTRRIIDELNALVNLEGLLSCEGELRGVVAVQEIRCRTKLLNHAYKEECALREVEEFLRVEEDDRCRLTNQFHAMTWTSFKTTHLFLQEETVRRSLRCRERAGWRDISADSRVARFFLGEADDRAVVGALEDCCREELKNRRVIELGNEVQRDIVLQSRLSVHLQCTEHSKHVKRSRRQLEMQEAKDRFALERLSSLHFTLLLQDAKIDYSAVIQRDVGMLSEKHRANIEEAHLMELNDIVRARVDHEQRLRFMIMEHQHKSFQSLKQAFLLGWRTVYTQITKDSDSTSVLRKIELFVRRDIMDQWRLEFNALLLEYQTHTSMLARHYIQRRALCQRYIDGARAISSEENNAANDLFGPYQVWEREQAALRCTTVLSTEEVAARWSIHGAEVEGRLGCKLQFLFERVHVQFLVGRRSLEMEEERCLGVLLQLHLHFFTEHVEMLCMRERTERRLIERDESTEAVDTFLRLRQASAHRFVSDASRPLLLLENELRSHVMVNEVNERNSLLQQLAVSSEAVHRLCLIERERRRRERLIAAYVSGLEAEARSRLCTSVEVGMFQVRECVLKYWERVSRKGLRESEVLRWEGLAFAAYLPAEKWPWHRTERTDMWTGMETDWGDAGSETAALWPSDSTPLGLSLACYSALRCEDMLVDAYLERDLIHFAEHREWLHLFKREGRLGFSLGNGPEYRPSWRLHSLSMHLEPQRRAAFFSAWHSNQSVDVSFRLTQQSHDAIIGERTVSVYAPDPDTTNALMNRDSGTGVVFFLIFDQEGTVLACATILTETIPSSSTYLCIPLENSKGFIRLV